MSDIFQEVHEEVRQEKYQQLWRTYGRYLIAGAVGLVLATAGYQFWSGYTKSKHEAQSVQFFSGLALLEEGHHDLASEAFSRLSDGGGDGYGILARFRRAEAMIAAGDQAAAVETYDRLAADTGAARQLRDLAALLAVMQLMETASADELRLRLAPLIEEDNPWRYSGRELAGVVAFRSGDIETARAVFSGLAGDPGVPNDMRIRAAEMLAVVGAPAEQENGE